MVLNFLGKKVHEGGLDADSLSSLLTSERDSIVAAAPPGLMDVLASAPRSRAWKSGDPLTPMPGDQPLRRRHAHRAQWAVAVARGRHRGRYPGVDRHLGVEATPVAERVTASVPAVDTVKARAGGIIDTAGGEVTTPISGLGSLGMRRLPNGIMINVPAYGMETRVIGFIEGAQPVSAHSTFDFDRLKFAAGSARILRPESQEQLNNVVSIMRAYPGVTVKIEGFSDNAGVASDEPEVVAAARECGQAGARGVRHRVEPSEGRGWRSAEPTRRARGHAQVAGGRQQSASPPWTKAPPGFSLGGVFSFASVRATHPV